LSGAGITRGYHNQPTLTAERYLPSPQGQRLYRTGDLARWRPDQQLDYHGRTDHQIKHHGHRIEPTEIETTLHTHPATAQAAVAIKNDTLTAYIVAPQLNSNPTPLLNHLRNTLPTPMIPTAWIFLNELPLTPNRKIDRNALPNPTPTTTPHQPPRTHIERLIATIWQHALNITTIGIHDNFFTLGGHSLLATRITNQLNIPLHTLFQHPTIAELAEVVPENAFDTTSIPRLKRTGRVEQPKERN
ncbi:phosphopantetheine-binding protein, partial [Actinocrispum wychmicini]